MNKNIEITLNSNNKNSEEYRAALALKEIFQQTIPDEAIGEITILSNVTLFGQKVKDLDLVVFGILNNCKMDISFSAPNEEIPRFNQVYINNICNTIELKGHPIDRIKREGTDIYVSYDDWHSATLQSSTQAYSLKNYFESRINESPYINNFIWLKSISKNEVSDLLDDNGYKIKSNILPGEFSFKDFCQLICDNNPPYKNNKEKYLIDNMYRCTSSSEELVKCINFFSSSKQAMGELTRKKIEQITSNLLMNDALPIGKMGICRGRAGTGKTHKLLQTAIKTVTEQDKRILVLTYNNALVSDIRRLLAFAEIPDGLNRNSVHITTIHKFIYQLLLATGVIPKGDTGFLHNYEELLSELCSYVNEDVLTENEIKEIKSRNYFELDWDLVFVDEAQDFNEVERNILVKFYGAANIIIAEGTDQLIRNNKYCDWAQGEEKSVLKLKDNLRQKSNLVSFINNYAKASGMEQFNMKPAKQMLGGKVIISTRPYLEAELHNEEAKKNADAGNVNYDYLFLVPPQLVTKDNNERFFSEIELYKKQGISLWDGTRSDLRTEYPVNTNEFRLLQYDSCRGLEGWTVVCLAFDKFINYKTASFNLEVDSDSFKLESPREQREKFVNNWALLPLTRAIDTLIITIDDKHSKTGELLYGIYQKNSDYISWIE